MPKEVNLIYHKFVQETFSSQNSPTPLKIFMLLSFSVHPILSFLRQNNISTASGLCYSAFEIVQDSDPKTKY